MKFMPVIPTKSVLLRYLDRGVQSCCSFFVFCIRVGVVISRTPSSSINSPLFKRTRTLTLRVHSLGSYIITDIHGSKLSLLKLMPVAICLKSKAPQSITPSLPVEPRYFWGKGGSNPRCSLSRKWGMAPCSSPTWALLQSPTLTTPEETRARSRRRT